MQTSVNFNLELGEDAGSSLLKFHHGLARYSINTSMIDPNFPTGRKFLNFLIDCTNILNT